MNRKKITKAAVTGLVAVTMVPAMTAPIVANAEDQNSEPSNEETVVTTQNEVGTSEETQVDTEAVVIETQDESGLRSSNEKKHPDKERTKVHVNYHDVETGNNFSDIIYLNYPALGVQAKDIEIPDGYQIVGDENFYFINYGNIFDSDDNFIIVDVKQVKQTVKINFHDEANDKYFDGEQVFTVPAEQTTIDAADVEAPEGYKVLTTGKIKIADGWILVEVEKIPETQEIGVNYWDIENNVQVKEGEVTVAADAYKVNTSALTDIPEGYELVNLGDIQIMDGWIYVEVRPVATTKSVGLNYWDIVNNKQVSEGSVVVDADATKVNTSTFTDIPAGYELVWTGDLAINDGWVWVEVRPVEEEIPEEFLAQLNVQIVDRETGEVLNSIQFLSDEKGTADATYTFVYG